MWSATFGAALHRVQISSQKPFYPETIMYASWLRPGEEEGGASRSIVLVLSPHIFLPSAPDSSTADTSREVPGPTPTSGETLGGLTVTDVSPNSLRVAWSAPPSSFHSFSLQYRDPKSNEPPRGIRVPGSERSVNVTGLRPSTEYELELRGEKPKGFFNTPVTTKTSTGTSLYSRNFPDCDW